MAKRLVVCCDGTWNVPDQQYPTNVTKVALAVSDTDSHGMSQRLFYHRGVGSNRREHIRGGAFGVGLSRDVCDAYRFLVHNYAPGDELFFFGFSRGAFTARSTVGLVRNAGILRRKHADRVPDAYALYRSRTNTKTPRGRESVLFRRSYSYEPRIRFIGVWDTVGALGIPTDGIPLINRFNKRWAFHNTDLSTYVDTAFQALAIDEKRGPFKPAVWHIQQDSINQRVEQMWFPGVHLDIGGGYADHGLSDLALLWMVERAREYGLGLREEAFQHAPPAETAAESQDVIRTCTAISPNPLGELHNSRRGFYRLLRPFHRRPEFTATTRETIAPSVFERRIGNPDYAPAEFARQLDSATTTAGMNSTTSWPGTWESADESRSATYRPSPTNSRLTKKCSERNEY